MSAWHKRARAAGTTKSDLIREAVKTYLADLEDEGAQLLAFPAAVRAAAGSSPGYRRAVATNSRPRPCSPLLAVRISVPSRLLDVANHNFFALSQRLSLVRCALEQGSNEREISHGIDQALSLPLS
jgi:hypothetical protein